MAIHGAGPIGVGVFLTLRRRGVESIIVEPSPGASRGPGGSGGPGARSTRPSCDAVSAIRDLTGGRGAHASVDAAGVPAAFRAMLHGTRIDGTAVVVAIHHHPLVIPPFDFLSENVRAVFWIATVPALVAVAVLVIGVREPEPHHEAVAPKSLPSLRELNQFGKGFWIVVAIGAMVTLARFSEAFLVLCASDAGLRIAWSPLALVVMNLTYFLSAYPVGRLSDRVGRVGLLVVGLAVLIVADIVLALGQNVATVLAGIAVWGLHMGLTQGIFAAMVADNAPPELRGSAFGIFNFLCGLVALLASLLAGALWQFYGPAATFYAGAIFSAAALAALLGWRRRAV